MESNFVTRSAQGNFGALELDADADDDLDNTKKDAEVDPPMAAQELAKGLDKAAMTELKNLNKSKNLKENTF